MVLYSLLLHSFAASNTTDVGALSLYSGLSMSHWSTYESKGQESPLPGSFSRVISYSQYSTGLSEKIDITVSLPLYYSYTSGGFPDTKTFASTFRPGSIAVSSNLSVLDAEEGKPFSLGATMAFRSGRLHDDVKSRLTSAGEGTRDVGMGIYLSRFLSISSVSLGLKARGNYWLRSPIDSDVDPQYPGDDITYGTSVFIGFPETRYSFELFMDGYNRISGVDYPIASEANIQREQQWTALRVAQTKLGLSSYISVSSNISAHLYGAYSVAAKNNPIDEMVLGAGFSFYKAKEKE